MEQQTKAKPVPVVLHYRGGTTERCLISPQIEADRETVTIVRDDQSLSEVPFARLKALFFLRDEELAPTEAPDDGGSMLVVEFADGEVIRGISSGYNPARNGFYLYPVDRSKNDKIFVVNSAIVSIDVEKL